MRLSDTGLRQRPTKLIYLNHRLPPWPNEDATRDRSSRLLGSLPVTFAATKMFGLATRRSQHDLAARYGASKVKAA